VKDALLSVPSGAILAQGLLWVIAVASWPVMVFIASVNAVGTPQEVERELLDVTAAGFNLFLWLIVIAHASTVITVAVATTKAMPEPSVERVIARSGVWLIVLGLSSILVLFLAQATGYYGIGPLLWEVF
tara:strand:- start:19932 stop:20321 length:390 start_codon:yes stop_codon:yes gene_type:complete